MAHRLSTVKDADEIIVMKEGAEIERGKHQELIDKKSHYYKLVQRQMVEDHLKQVEAAELQEQTSLRKQQSFRGMEGKQKSDALV